jgi:hypothetical protein
VPLPSLAIPQEGPVPVHGQKTTRSLPPDHPYRSAPSTASCGSGRCPEAGGASRRRPEERAEAGVTMRASPCFVRSENRRGSGWNGPWRWLVRPGSGAGHKPAWWYDQEPARLPAPPLPRTSAWSFRSRALDAAAPPGVQITGKTPSREGEESQEQRKCQSSIRVERGAGSRVSASRTPGVDRPCAIPGGGR